MVPITPGLLGRGAFCGVLAFSAAALSACCTGPTTTTPPPPHPLHGSPILCTGIPPGTYAGANVSLNVPAVPPVPPPEPPGIKHNVMTGVGSAAGWCEASSSTSINITKADGQWNDAPIAVWLLTQGTGTDIHVQDDGLHNGTPTPGLDTDLVPQNQAR